MSLKALTLLLAIIAATAWAEPRAALAQFTPPQTLVGSIADSAGEIPENTSVDAYIGDVRCTTEDVVTYRIAGVTMYVIDVVSDSQIEGCGDSGAVVRIKVGSRFAESTVPWRAGLLVHSITFGQATPIPIPTFTATATPAFSATPTPTRVPRTPTPPPSTPPPTSLPSETPSGDATTPAGSDTSGTPTQSGAETPTGAESQATASPTLAGGISTNGNAQPETEDDNDRGTPIWVFVLILVAVVAAVGGGLGYFLSRSPGEDVPLPPGDEH